MELVSYGISSVMQFDSHHVQFRNLGLVCLVVVDEFTRFVEEVDHGPHRTICKIPDD